MERPRWAWRSYRTFPCPCFAVYGVDSGFSELRLAALCPRTCTSCARGWCISPQQAVAGGKTGVVIADYGIRSSISLVPPDLNNRCTEGNLGSAPRTGLLGTRYRCRAAFSPTAIPNSNLISALREAPKAMADPFANPAPIALVLLRRSSNLRIARDPQRGRSHAPSATATSVHFAGTVSDWMPLRRIRGLRSTRHDFARADAALIRSRTEASKDPTGSPLAHPGLPGSIGGFLWQRENEKTPHRALSPNLNGTGGPAPLPGLRLAYLPAMSLAAALASSEPAGGVFACHDVVAHARSS